MLNTTCVPTDNTTPWQGEVWLESLCRQRPEAEQQVLHQAWTHLQAGAAAKPDPEAYLRRRCGTADILHQVLDMNFEALAAALLDMEEETPAEIQSGFGDNIARLTDGLGRMRVIHELHSLQQERDIKQSGQTEKFRKMLLAMAEDARVVLITLAESLYTMRALRHAEAEQQRRVARETLDIFAPLANRLGIWTLKWELEDLAFRYLDPPTYQRLAGLLDTRRTEREQYVDEIVATLRERFAAAGIDAEVYGRPKHIYSIWKKMQRKGVDFEQLFDVLAVRTLVDSTAECYTALGVVHSAWQPIQGEFDDYIAVPKKNGYRSLHTAVMGPEERPFEVQIRTREMHRLAEFGVASHWRYKEGVAHDGGFEQKLAWLRQVLQSREEDGDSGILDEFSSEIIEDRVYTLTPQGKIVDLPQGATPLDFAYAVHTDVGHRCRGTKVNGKMVALTTVLKTGDTVDVITAKQASPSRDWLGPGQKYLKSPRAVAKVKQWFKQRDRDQHLHDGRLLLEKELKRFNLAHDCNYEQLAKKQNFNHPDDMFIALGRNEINAAKLVASACKEYVLPQKPVMPVRRPSAKKDSAGGKDDSIQVQGVEGLLTQMAGCCKPMPPDPLVGYITRGQGVTIHRQDCPRVLHLRETEHERLIEVDWYHPQGTVHPVDIEVEAYDRTGLLRDISNVLSMEKINITAVHTGNRRDEEEMLTKAKMILTIEVHDAEELSSVLRKVEDLQNVMSAKRKSGG